MTHLHRSPLFRAALLSPLAAAVMALSAPAQAQNLQTLYEAARGFDATYLGAVAQADSARAKADQAQALILPTPRRAPSRCRPSRACSTAPTA